MTDNHAALLADDLVRVKHDPVSFGARCFANRDFIIRFLRGETGKVVDFPGDHAEPAA